MHGFSGIWLRSVERGELKVGFLLSFRTKADFFSK
jgi:hypothetical protein